MDQRSIRTRKAIKTALINLMKTTSLPKISVTEVVRTAGITRATFYLHYQNINQLYDDLCNDFLIDLGSIVVSSYKNKTKLDYEFLNQQLYTYLYKNKAIHVLLYNKDNQIFISKLKKELLYKIMKHEEISTNDIYSQIEIPFIISGAVEVYSKLILKEIPVKSSIAIEQINKILRKF
ncbi:TetR/AcrR family transcriptional regulator [Fructilactobacillus florum]|uniref:TetR/AcrR family transcriptional regulator n=1 Tax=Fructilactobacillus florum TaxID=640331 RepID=UPI00058D50FB|nr:TetR/AcrR family transcriptional regulator [Fructilactobacillus florum]